MDAAEAFTYRLAGQSREAWVGSVPAPSPPILSWVWIWVIQSDSLLEYVDEIATSAPLGLFVFLVVGLGRFEDLIR